MRHRLSPRNGGLPPLNRGASKEARTGQRTSGDSDVDDDNGESFIINIAATEEWSVAPPG